MLEYGHINIFFCSTKTNMFILYWYTYAPAANIEETRKAGTQRKLVVIMKVCMSIYDKHL